MGIFLMIIGLGLAGAGVAVLTLASGGPFPSESIAGFVALAIGGIYAMLGAIHIKTKILGKVIRATSTPLWLYVVGLLIVFVIVYCFLGGGFFSIIAVAIGLIVTLIVAGVFALWTIFDRLAKHVTSSPFWFYIVALLPVLVLTYFLFGALWR